MRKKIAIVIAVVVALAIVGTGYGIVYAQNKVFAGVSLAYQESQCLSANSGDTVDASIWFIDSTGFFASLDGDSVTATLSGGDTGATVTAVAIDINQTPTFLSPYGLYEVTITVQPPTDRAATRDTQLTLNDRTFDIGSLTILQTPEQDYPDLDDISADLATMDATMYDMTVSNNLKQPVTISAVSYSLDRKLINLLKSPVVIKAGASQDLHLPTGFTTNDYTIQPLITYEYQGKTYTQIAVGPTQYMISLGKQDVIDYIKAHR